MNHKPTCHFSGALSDLASSVQKSHEKDPTTNFYFLTISCPLQKLDPLCLWFLGNGRSGRCSLTELGVGALNLHLHQSSSTPTRAAAAASGLQRLQGLSWESSSRLELSDSKDWASRGLQDLSSDAQLTCLISYTRHHGYIQPFHTHGKADVDGNWGKGFLLSLKILQTKFGGRASSSMYILLAFNDWWKGSFGLKSLIVTAATTAKRMPSHYNSTEKSRNKTSTSCELSDFSDSAVIDQRKLRKNLPLSLLFKPQIGLVIDNSLGL